MPAHLLEKKFVFLSNSPSSSCQRTSYCTRNNFVPLSLALFMLAHQLLHEIHFTYPSKSNSFSSWERAFSCMGHNSRSLQIQFSFIIMSAHLFLPEILFTFPKSNTFSSCQRSNSSTRYNSWFPPTHLLDAGAPTPARETIRAPVQFSSCQRACTRNNLRFPPNPTHLHASTPTPA